GRIGYDHRLVQVGFIGKCGCSSGRTQRSLYCRCSPGLNDRDLRRTLAQIPERPSIVRVDLMVDANHLVPGLTMLHRREVQLWARWKVERPVRAFGDPFQTAEEVEFVPEIGPPKVPPHCFSELSGFA